MSKAADGITIIDWEKVPSLTLDELTKKAGVVRGSGRTLSATTKAINDFMVWVRVNDAYGQARPVISYRNDKTAKSLAQRLRHAHKATRARDADQTWEESGLSKGLWSMRYIDLREGEKLFAANVRNINGTNDVYIALLLDGISKEPS